MRLWAGTLLAFLGGLVIAPDATLAGCTPHDRPTIGLGFGLESPGLAEGVTPGDATSTPGGPKPCDGELCSSRPAMPVSPAPSPDPRVGLRAILDLSTKITPPGRVEGHPDDGQVCPSLRAASIFHPPRRSASHLAS